MERQRFLYFTSFSVNYFLSLIITVCAYKLSDRMTSLFWLSLVEKILSLIVDNYLSTISSLFSVNKCNIISYSRVTLRKYSLFRALILLTMVLFSMHYAVPVFESHWFHSKFLFSFSLIIVNIVNDLFQFHLIFNVIYVIYIITNNHSIGIYRMVMILFIIFYFQIQLLI
jgi:hypothetical protein